MTQIHWFSAVDGDFNNGAQWTGGQVPQVGDDAYIDASGQLYTVTLSQPQAIRSLHVGSQATLSILASENLYVVSSGGIPPNGNAGSILVGDGASLHVGGWMSNTGTISVNSAGSNTALQADAGSLVLFGGGKVKLSDSPNNAIYSDGGFTTLVNVDNTIAGAGRIGDASLQVFNDSAGMIKATGVSPLILSTPGMTMSNQGTMKASGTGGLVIMQTTIDQGFAGKIKAASGSFVGLQGAVIVGGTLATAGSGVIKTLDNASVLDGAGAAVVNTGVIDVPDSTGLTLVGGIDNTGTIAMQAVVGATLTLGNNVTLTGGGQLTMSDMSDAGADLITGQGAFTLVNVDNTISGAGQLGGGQMVLDNLTAGVIDATGTNKLNIDTGANLIKNDGLIEATGSGNGSVKSPLRNNGVVEANGGTLELDGAVTGTGQAIIAAGNLYALGAFEQNVTFTGTSGVLGLGLSQSYNGVVTGFSTAGGTSLDLADINFVSSNEATFSGNATGGVLTVTDGAHTAHINLSGNYTGSTFTVSANPNFPGVIVVDPARRPTPPLPAFVQAMAGLAHPSSTALASALHASRPWSPMLGAGHAHPA